MPSSVPLCSVTVPGNVMKTSMLDSSAFFGGAWSLSGVNLTVPSNMNVSPSRFRLNDPLSLSLLIASSGVLLREKREPTNSGQ